MVSLTDIQRFFRGTIKLSEPLAQYTDLHVGGTADYFLKPASEEEFAELIQYLRKNEFPFVIVQPNMLVSDKGFRGAAIYFKKDTHNTLGNKRHATMFRSPPDISVAVLVERAGLNGMTMGGATVLADCIVNANEAKATDILSLVTHVQRTIKKQYGVHLELDFQLVGFEEEALAKVA